MIGTHFFPGTTFVPQEIASEAEVKSADELRVELPEPNGSFHSLAMSLAAELPRDASLPAPADFAKWQTERRAKLAEIVKAKQYAVQAEAIADEVRNGSKATFWKLKIGGDWTIPAMEIVRCDPKSSVIVVSDNGRAGAAEMIEALLASGKRVVAVDPFYFGESKIAQRDFLFGLLISAVGERPLGLQASQLAATARWAQSQYRSGPVTVVALGPRSSLFTLVAAGLESSAIAAIDLRGTLGSLKETIEQNRGVNEAPDLFTFGLLEEFDIKQLLALVGPRPIIIGSPISERARRELMESKVFGPALPPGVPSGVIERAP